MNIIPNDIEDWKLDTINELIKLRDIESEKFDFKSSDVKDLSKHLCAFANTEGGFIVLGVDEIKNGQILIEFKKTGFKKGKEDEIKKQIKNFQIQIDPIPKLQIEPIYEGEKFFVVIKIEDNNFNKPYCVKQKGAFYVRIGSSSEPASRNTILNLFSDTNKQIQDLENLKASAEILKEDYIMTIGKFRYIKPAAPNRLPKIDLTLFRNNIAKCQSFLIKKRILGKLLEVRRAPLLAPFLHTLDTLNSYIDGFSNSTEESIKERYYKQIQMNAPFTLSKDLEFVEPFLDNLLAAIEEHLSKIKNNS